MPPPNADESPYRFEVALSFAGDNKRDKVRQIASTLRNKLGDGKVFFDEWFEAELAGHDAVAYLHNVYGKQAQLVVTCVCARYNEKPWTQDEWRAIQAFERGLRDVNSGNIKRMRFLPLRFGDGEVDGLFSTAIVPDVRDRTPQAIAKLILERLRLSKGGGPNDGQSARGEADPELQDDVARPYEPTESREWYHDSRNRLLSLTQEIFEESEVTRKFVLQCNGMALSMNAESLARTIFDSNEPMDYLRSCHNQAKIKSKLPQESRQELHSFLYRLIDYIAPACYTVDDLKAMEPHVHRQEGDYAPVPTNSKCIAVTKVAAMKGVRADLNTYSTWGAFNLTILPESREILAQAPSPPDSGRRPGPVEKPVDALVAVLADAVNAAQKNAEFVQAKLKRLADKDKVYFIILFENLRSESYLREIHEAFPELVLLVAAPSPRPSDSSRLKEVTLEQDISDLRNEFGPQQSGSAPA